MAFLSALQQEKPRMLRLSLSPACSLPAHTRASLLKIPVAKITSLKNIKQAVEEYPLPDFLFFIVFYASLRPFM